MGRINPVPKIPAVRSSLAMYSAHALQSFPRMQIGSQSMLERKCLHHLIKGDFAPSDDREQRQRDLEPRREQER